MRASLAPFEMLPNIEALSELYKLTAEPTLASLGSFSSGLFGLGGLTEGALPLNATSEQWKKVQAEPVYRWLEKHDNYRKALAVFQRKRKFVNAGSTIKSDLALFHFINTISLALMVYTNERDPAKRRRLPDKRTARRALNCISFLSHADFGYLANRKQMEDALGGVRRALEETLGTRKVKEGAHYAERRFVQALTWHFLSKFEQTLHLGIRELCGLIGYFPGDTTLQDVIKEVKVRQQRVYRHQLAAALRADLGKNAKNA